LQAGDERDKSQAMESGACEGFALLPWTLASLRHRGEHHPIYSIQPYTHGVIRVQVCPYPYP
jgi:hypothetical protein